MFRDMDPMRKRALAIRAAQAVAFIMLVFGFIMIILFWE